MMASFSAPLMEETLKGSAVLLLFLFKKDQFDDVLDGIIYAGVTALGFAMVENVEYYGGAAHLQEEARSPSLSISSSAA